MSPVKELPSNIMLPKLVGKVHSDMSPDTGVFVQTKLTIVEGKTHPEIFPVNRGLLPILKFIRFGGNTQLVMSPVILVPVPPIEKVYREDGKVQLVTFPEIGAVARAKKPMFGGNTKFVKSPDRDVPDMFKYVSASGKDQLFISPLKPIFEIMSF